MQPIIEVRFAMVTNGYTSIVPVIGEKTRCSTNGKRPKTSTRKMLEDSEPQLSERQQYRDPYQTGADARP